MFSRFFLIFVVSAFSSALFADGSFQNSHISAAHFLVNVTNFSDKVVEESGLSCSFSTSSGKIPAGTTLKEVDMAQRPNVGRGVTLRLRLSSNNISIAEIRCATLRKSNGLITPDQLNLFFNGAIVFQYEKGPTSQDSSPYL